MKRLCINNMKRGFSNMTYNELLFGIATNVITSIGQIAFNEVAFKDDSTQIEVRMVEALDKTTKTFFDKYKNKYGRIEESFMGRETNIELIYKSMFPGEDINLIKEINRNGFNGNPLISENDLKEFLNEFYKQCKKDFLLSELLSNKEFKKETLDHLEGIHRKFEDLKLGLLADNKSSFENFNFFDAKTNTPIDIELGKKYIFSDREGKITYMFDKETVFVKKELVNGTKSYLEYNIKNDSIENLKLPYPLSDYQLEYDKDELVRSDIEYLNGGYYQKMIYLEFRKCTVLYDRNDMMVGFSGSRGWEINDKEKIIRPTQS